MIQSPAELRGKSLSELEDLAQEIRQKIINTCLKNGGHLGASLGAVELAIALHRVFDSPSEPVIWDVGHQAYAHKLLTGRWDRFETLRREGGISGFLSREESPHDVFGAGHSSTSLSVALAMAWAARGAGKWTVAVIGDGGLTAGLAFEALNNLKELQTGPLLLVLNDNQMSISPNAGALPTILSGQNAREYFAMFGLDYVGPVDGHDLGGLIGTMQTLKTHPGARVVLHAITQKGKGYLPAEESPATYHGVGPVGKSSAKSYSDVFGEAICAIQDPQVVAVTAAMSEGTGLSDFSRKNPERFFDVGIAEQHAVTFAAGLAARGVRPVVCIYSTFLQRALDSVVHDVALQKLPVVFVVDRAGVVGADGPTHHGAFDLTYLGMIPGMRISSPACLDDLAPLLARALKGSEPWAIRISRGGGPNTLETPIDDESLRWHRKSTSPRLIVVALGPATPRVLEAARDFGPEVTVVSTLDAKPIPPALIRYLEVHPDAALMTVEDGSVRGGFGQSVLTACGPRRFDLAGYGDHFIPHGAPAVLEDAEGLSSAKLRQRMETLLR